MKYAVPSSFFRRASAAAAPSSIAVWPSWPQACIFPGTFDACVTPDFSVMWSASRSARRPIASLPSAAAGAVAKDADDAGSGETGVDLEAERGELLRDERARDLFLERGFRMRVDLVPPRLHFRDQRGNFRDELHRRTLLMLGPAAANPAARPILLIQA